MYLLILFTVFTGVSSYQELLNENTLEYAQNLFNEKCTLNGVHKDAYSLQEEVLDLNTCLQSYLNFTHVQDELEDARRRGVIDEFVKKYCDEYPQIYKCLKRTVDRLRSCLNSTEQVYVDKSLELVEFAEKKLCYQDGLRVAMLIAAGGIECVQEKQEQLNGCVNETIENPPSSLQDLIVSMKDISLEEACSHLMSVRFCFRKALLRCKTNIPANVIDALFKSVKTEMSCKVQPLRQEEDDYFLIKVIVGVVYLILVGVLCYKLSS